MPMKQDIACLEYRLVQSEIHKEVDTMNSVLESYRLCDTFAKLVANIHAGKATEVSDKFCKNIINYELEYSGLNYTVYCNQIQQDGPLIYVVLVDKLSETLNQGSYVGKYKILVNTVSESHDAYANVPITICIYDSHEFRTPGMQNYTALYWSVCTLMHANGIVRAMYSQYGSDQALYNAIALYYACAAYIGIGDGNDFDDYISKAMDKQFAEVFLRILNRVFDKNRYYTDVQQSVLEAISEEENPHNAMHLLAYKIIPELVASDLAEK